MRYLDSSRIALDQICPRARYWGYEYAGTGLELTTADPDLYLGKVMAHSIAQFRQQHEWPQDLPLDPQSQVLAQGLLEAYARYIWPQWEQDYELVGTEVECAYALSEELLYQARPDAILRRKSDGSYWVLSDKTTSQSADTFTRQWDKAMQNHAECVCVEKMLGLTVSGYFTQGWLKGYLKGESRYSPVCNAWCKIGQPGIGKDQWSTEYKYGWTRRLVNQYPGGISAWVAQLDPQICKAQFPVAGPTMLNRALVVEYFDQEDTREWMIRHLTPPLTAFPRHVSQCNEFGKYRRPCSYRDCCWVPTVGHDPVGSGLYQRRTPNHPESEVPHDAE